MSRHNRPLAYLAGIVLLALPARPAFADPAAAPEAAVTIPAGTHVTFRLTTSISSNQSKTGDAFTFVLLEPIQVDGRVILPAGTVGSGTVYLSGKAGTSGHEGDLTLRLDSMRTPGDAVVSFADQRFEINGQNRKIVAGLLGFVPFAGAAARFIRGSDIRVDETRKIETVLQRPATIAVAPEAPNASPSPPSAPAR